MKSFNIASLCAVVLGATACGAEDGDSRFDLLEALIAEDPEAPRAFELAHELNRDMERQLGLLHRLELGEGHSFAFFEPLPGMFLTFEEGTLDRETEAVSDAIDGLSFSEMHALLKPGVEIPQVLIQADERRTTQKEGAAEPLAPLELTSGGGRPSAALELGDNIARTSRGLTASQFLAADGCPDGDTEVCLLDWWNGAWAAQNAHRAKFRVSPVSGAVLFGLYAKGSNIGLWSVLQGQFGTWSWHLGHSSSCYPIPIPPFVVCSATANPDKGYLRGEITFASGDHFHYGAAFDQGD